MSKFTLPKALTEQDYREIMKSANAKMLRWLDDTRQRGVAFSVHDSIYWWVMKETEGRVLASSGRRHCAERQPLIDRLQTLDAAVRKATAMLEAGLSHVDIDAYEVLKAALDGKPTPDEDAA